MLAPRTTAYGLRFGLLNRVSLCSFRTQGHRSQGTAACQISTILSGTKDYSALHFFFLHRVQEYSHCSSVFIKNCCGPKTNHTYEYVSYVYTTSVVLQNYEFRRSETGFFSEPSSPRLPRVRPCASGESPTPRINGATETGLRSCLQEALLSTLRFLSYGTAESP